MPQGLLQVDRLVTSQKLLCIVSGAIDRAKSHRCKILAITLTRSRFCAEEFFLTQWNQDFSYTQGGGGVSVVGRQWSVAREASGVRHW